MSCFSGRKFHIESSNLGTKSFVGMHLVMNIMNFYVEISTLHTVYSVSKNSLRIIAEEVGQALSKQSTFYVKWYLKIY